VIVPQETWDELTEPKITLASWLIENSPGVDFELPARGSSADRSSPFDPT